ncbi:MAG: hypothetical protein FWG64_12315 [Firmicutes bacterium]|nr:hypothetical protein [Bacillota bacterium]
MKKFIKLTSFALAAAMAIGVNLAVQANAATIPTIEMTNVLESRPSQQTPNNYDFSNVTGWSNPTGDGEMGFQLVGENNQPINLPTLWEFVASETDKSAENSETAESATQLEFAAAEVFKGKTLADIAKLDYTIQQSTAAEVIILARVSIIFDNAAILEDFSRVAPDWDLGRIVGFLVEVYVSGVLG